MSPANDNELKALVRERFTRTAEVFGDYAVAHRVTEAERLARMVSAGLNDRAVDLACGPGTLALRFAHHVLWICGLDLTPAILALARNNAKKDRLSNLFCVLGDAQALPFGDGSLDIAVTSYSLHHISDPAKVLNEMARVVKPGGRVGVLDIVVPEDPKIRELNHRSSTHAIIRILARSRAVTLRRSLVPQAFISARRRYTGIHGPSITGCTSPDGSARIVNTRKLAGCWNLRWTMTVPIFIRDLNPPT